MTSRTTPPLRLVVTLSAELEALGVPHDTVARARAYEADHRRLSLIERAAHDDEMTPTLPGPPALTPDAASAPQWRVVAVVTAREDGSLRVSKHISDAPHAPDPARAGQAWAATPEGYIRGRWAVLVRVSAPGEAPRVVRLKPRTVIDAEVLP